MKSMSEVTAFLEEVYDTLNVRLFGGELPKAILTVQSSKAYGHYTLGDVWNDGLRGYREINIGAEALGRPIEEVVATLVHEMVHYLNDLHGVQDVSRSGWYHNRSFKEAAEAHELIVEYYSDVGFGVTAPSDGLVALIAEQGWRSIEIARDKGVEGGKRVRKPSSTRKYICPVCGMSVRATKTVRVGCQDCQATLIEVPRSA